MFQQVTRFSATKGMEVGEKIYREKAKAMWGSQPGFHSMSMFNIDEGDHKGQRMVVIRFKDKASLDKAREAVADQREAVMKELNEAGIKAEEVIRLEQID